MNKLIKILKTYLKSWIIILPPIIIGQFIGDLIIYYNYGSITDNLIECNRLIMGTSLSALSIAFLLYPIEKTVPIYDESIFRKKLNESLTRNKLKNLSDKENILVIKYSFIKKFIFGKELSIYLYNDKAMLKSSRAIIIALCNTLNRKKR